MIESALAGVAAVTLVSFVGTGWALRLARRRSILAHPNERSSHSAPTPSGGGLGLGLTAVLGLALAGLATEYMGGERALLWAALPVALACWVGWRDDVRPLPPLAKLAVLTVAAGTLVALRRFDAVEIPGLGSVGFGVLTLPLMLFWLAGFTNAFNFMDGIDGIAGLTAAVSGLVYAASGMASDVSAVVALGVIIAGSAVGFLPWNFPRARIFMGDAGSLVLGLLLAFTAVVADVAGSLSFPASVLLLGPFIFDTSITLVRRAIRGERVWRAHREHLYQRLARIWGAHAPVSLLYAAFSVACGVLALAYDGLGTSGRLLSLGGPLAAMLAFAALVLVIDRRRRKALRVAGD